MRGPTQEKELKKSRSGEYPKKREKKKVKENAKNQGTLTEAERTCSPKDP